MNLSKAVSLEWGLASFLILVLIVSSTADKSGLSVECGVNSCEQFYYRLNSTCQDGECDEFLANLNDALVIDEFDCKVAAWPSGVLNQQYLSNDALFLSPSLTGYGIGLSAQIGPLVYRNAIRNQVVRLLQCDSEQDKYILAGVDAGPSAEYSCNGWEIFLSWAGACNHTSEYWDGQSCQPVTTCLPGYKVASKGTYQQDRTCEKCPAGSYQDQENQDDCKAARRCGKKQYELQGPTESTNRVCENCGKCYRVQNREYEKYPCTKTTNTICEPWRTCPSGTYFVVPTDYRKDGECEPCQTGTYMDEVNHQHEQCKAVTPSCDPGQYQVNEPWVDLDRSCSNCPDGTFTDTPNTASSCRPWSNECHFQPGFVELSPPSSTSDRICHFNGAELPQVSCPARQSVGTIPHIYDYYPTFSKDDFKASASFSSIISKSIIRSDQQPFNSSISPGQIVTFTFKASTISGLTSCQTEFSVLSAQTQCINDDADDDDSSSCSFGQGAVDSLISSHDLDVFITGDISDVLFKVNQTELPPGISLELTTDFADDDDNSNSLTPTWSNSSKIHLRADGVPKKSGTFFFDIIVYSTLDQEMSSTIINLKPFKLVIVDCLDDYDSCMNQGQCLSPDMISIGGEAQIQCSCQDPYLPNPDDSGRCTLLKGSISLECPCDLQLVSGLNPLVNIPSSYLNSFRVSRGEVISQRLSRSDDQTLTSPIPSGQFITFQLSAQDEFGATVSCTSSVAVASIIVDESNLPAVYYWKEETLPTADVPLLIPFNIRGLLPARTLNYSLDPTEALELASIGAAAASSSERTQLYPQMNPNRTSDSFSIFFTQSSVTESLRNNLHTKHDLNLIAEIVDDNSFVQPQFEACLEAIDVVDTVKFLDDNAVFVTENGNLGLDLTQLTQSPDRLAVDFSDCPVESCSDCIDEIEHDGQFSCICDSVQTQDETCTEFLLSHQSDDKKTIYAIVFPILAIALLVLILIWFYRHRVAQQLSKSIHVTFIYIHECDQDLVQALAQAINCSEYKFHINTTSYAPPTCFADADSELKDKLEAIQNSCIVMPIMSEASLQRIKSNNNNEPDFPSMDMMKEMEFAINRLASNRLRILPLLIGSTYEKEYNFRDFGGHTFAVETSPGCMMTTSDIITKLLRCQGIKYNDYCEAENLAPSELTHRILSACIDISWGLPLQNGSLIRSSSKKSKYVFHDESHVKSGADKDIDCLNLHRYWKGEVISTDKSTSTSATTDSFQMSTHQDDFGVENSFMNYNPMFSEVSEA